MEAYLIISKNTPSFYKKVEELVSSQNIQKEKFCKIIEREKEKQFIAIEEVKTIKKFLARKNTRGTKKIVLIPEARFLREDAQNTLLKTIEDLSQNSVIAFGVPNKEFLLQTVISRCAVVYANESVENTFQFQDLAKEALKIKGEGEILDFFYNNPILYEKRDNALDFINCIEYLIFTEKIESQKVASNICKYKELLVNSNVSLRLLLENIFLT